jgi:phosphoesterase RecJ-like protein
MPLDWAPLVELVRSHDRFLLLTHVRPDGDALGSQLAMADALEQRGKSVRIVIGSDLPERYFFMDPDRRIERFTPSIDAFAQSQAVIVLDTGTWNQLGACGAPMKAMPGPKVVIDHHLTQDDLGATRLVDTTAEATGRLVVEATDAMGAQISPKAATALFIALAMDTGWFRHSQTRPETFELAARLNRAGARPDRIFEHLYERNPLGRIRLLGRALERLRCEFDGFAVVSEVYVSDFPELQAHPLDTEDIVQHTRTIDGVELGLLLIEQLNGSVKVSLRSRGRIDVARLAEQFGGGGHSRAAGATLTGTVAEVRAKLLAAVRVAMATLP